MKLFSKLGLLMAALGSALCPWSMKGRGEFQSREGVRRNANGRGHGSAGYATDGALGASRCGARRSIRRAAQIHAGKFVRR